MKKMLLLAALGLGMLAGRARGQCVKIPIEQRQNLQQQIPLSPDPKKAQTEEPFFISKTLDYKCQ